MLGFKPKGTRAKKTIEEKLNDLAGKALLEAMKKDPEVLRQYVKKQYGIDIRTQSERVISQVVEHTKLRVITEVADNIAEDPEVQDTLRDKLVAELLGVSPQRPKAKEDRRQTKGNYRSQLDRVLHDIDKLEQLKDRLGVNTGGLSKLLQNPEVIKALFGMVQGLMGSSGLTPVTATAESNERMYALEIDGKYIEMDHDAYMQYRSQQNGLELPKARHTTPDQKEPKDKPVTASGNPKTWLPPIISSAKIPDPDNKKVQEVITQPTSVQPNAADDLKKMESGTTR